LNTANAIPFTIKANKLFKIFLYQNLITTKRSANADWTALRVWNAKCASFLLGWVPLGPSYTGTGSSSAKMLIHSIGSWSRYNLPLEDF